MPTRRKPVVEQLLGLIRSSVPHGRKGLVAIDRVDGAGKSHLAEELIRLSVGRPGRSILGLSIDGFHHPRRIRHANGVGPESFYRDSYDYATFATCVAEPLRQGSPVIPAVWDATADRPANTGEVVVPDDGIVLVDGIFLHRPELRDLWDASIFIDVPFEISVPRGNQRFAHLGDADPESTANHRYVGGQRLYFQESSPWDHATWILDNSDLDSPMIKKNERREGSAIHPSNRNNSA